jgi:hypothetical protein
MTAMDGEAVLAAIRGSAEFMRLQSANWLLTQRLRDAQHKLDTAKAERDNWRARCGQ